MDEDEAIRRYPLINHALVIVKAGDDYLLGFHKYRDDWETFGGLYGVSISREMFKTIEEKRRDKDEIGEIACLQDLKRIGAKIDENNCLNDIGTIPFGTSKTSEKE